MSKKKKKMSKTKLLNGVKKKGMNKKGGEQKGGKWGMGEKK